MTTADPAKFGQSGTAIRKVARQQKSKKEINTVRGAYNFASRSIISYKGRPRTPSKLLSQLNSRLQWHVRKLRTQRIVFTETALWSR